MRIGIVGCGHWGAKWIRIFSGLGARVKALCDVDERRLMVAASKAPGATLFRSHHSMIAMGEVEAIYVSTPPPTHFQIAKDCLTAGKHVLVEKPMTMSLEQGVELMSLAEENDRILMVGNTFMYNRAVRELRSLVDKGEIGLLRHIRSCMTDSVDMWARKIVSNYVDVLWDLGPHPISIALFLVNQEPSTISVTCAPPLLGKASRQPPYDVAVMNLHFPSGLSAVIYLNWFNYSKDRRITLFGDEGVLSCEDPSSRGSTRIHLERLSLESTTVKSLNTRVWKVDTSDTLERECSHFLRCVRERLTPLTGGKEGLAVVRVLEAGHRSMMKGGRVGRVV